MTEFLFVCIMGAVAMFGLGWYLYLIMFKDF